MMGAMVAFAGEEPAACDRTGSPPRTLGRAQRTRYKAEVSSKYSGDLPTMTWMGHLLDQALS